MHRDMSAAVQQAGGVCPCTTMSWWAVACAPASPCGCPCCVVSIAPSTMQLTSHRMACLKLQVRGVSMCGQMCWLAGVPAARQLFGRGHRYWVTVQRPPLGCLVHTAQLVLHSSLSSSCSLLEARRVLSLTQGVTGAGPVAAWFLRWVEGAQGKGHGLSLSGLSMRCCCCGFRAHPADASVPRDFSLSASLRRACCTTCTALCSARGHVICVAFLRRLQDRTTDVRRPRHGATLRSACRTGVLDRLDRVSSYTCRSPPIKFINTVPIM